MLRIDSSSSISSTPSCAPMNALDLLVKTIIDIVRKILFTLGLLKERERTSSFSSEASSQASTPRVQEIDEQFSRIMGYVRIETTFTADSKENLKLMERAFQISTEKQSEGYIAIQINPLQQPLALSVSYALGFRPTCPHSNIYVLDKTFIPKWRAIVQEQTKEKKTALYEALLEESQKVAAEALNDEKQMESHCKYENGRVVITTPFSQNPDENLLLMEEAFRLSVEKRCKWAIDIYVRADDMANAPTVGLMGFASATLQSPESPDELVKCSLDEQFISHWETIIQQETPQGKKQAYQEFISWATNEVQSGFEARKCLSSFLTKNPELLQQLLQQAGLQGDVSPEMLGEVKQLFRSALPTQSRQPQPLNFAEWVVQLPKSYEYSNKHLLIKEFSQPYSEEIESVFPNCNRFKLSLKIFVPLKDLAQVKPLGFVEESRSNERVLCQMSEWAIPRWQNIVNADDKAEAYEELQGAFETIQRLTNSLDLD